MSNDYSFRYKLNVDAKVIQAGKFDMKTSAQERRQLLQAILTKSSNEDDVSSNKCRRDFQRVVYVTCVRDERVIGWFRTRMRCRTTRQ